MAETYIQTISDTNTTILDSVDSKGGTKILSVIDRVSTKEPNRFYAEFVENETSAAAIAARNKWTSKKWAASSVSSESTLPRRR